MSDSPGTPFSDPGLEQIELREQGRSFDAAAFQAQDAFESILVPAVRPTAPPPISAIRAIQVASGPVPLVAIVEYPAIGIAPNGELADINYILNLVSDLDECAPNKAGFKFRWFHATFYCLLQTYVTTMSTSYVSALDLIMEKFGVSPQVAMVGQTVMIIGYGIGPIFLSPLSDVWGRKWVYVATTVAYGALNIGCAYSVDFGMLSIFMLLLGLAGSVVLTNAAGTVADCFGDGIAASNAMAVFILSANAGPAIGAWIGAVFKVNPNLGLEWLYLCNAIVAAAFAVVMCFLEETLPRIHIANKARENLFNAGRLAVTGREVTEFDLDILQTKIIWKVEFAWILTNVYNLFHEPILMYLAVFNGFTYGILFLYLDGVNEVFVIHNNLSYSIANLTYLNFLVGTLLMALYTPVQTLLYKRAKRKTPYLRNRPESHFLTSRIAVWLFPVSLFWFAFTCEGNTSYWSPIVAGAVLAFADALLWQAMLLYVTDSYPHVAASALTVFFVPSFLIGAGLSHLGQFMYPHLGAKWSMAVLGFVSIILCIAVEIAYKCGEPMRIRSTEIRKGRQEFGMLQNNPNADLENGGIVNNGANPDGNGVQPHQSVVYINSENGMLMDSRGIIRHPDTGIPIRDPTFGSSYAGVMNARLMRRRDVGY